VVNAVLRNGLVRKVMEAVLGFAAERTMPPYARERFDKWFARHEATAGTERRLAWVRPTGTGG